MKTSLRPFIAALAVLALVATARAAATAGGGDQFERAKSRVDFLLGLRRNPKPLPANPPNPFNTPGQLSGIVLEPTPNETPAGEPTASPASDPTTDNLAKLTSLLKVSGYVNIGGVPHVIINQQPYKQGAQVIIRQKGEVVSLHLKNVSPTSFTVELNGAEQTIRIGK